MSGMMVKVAGTVAQLSRLSAFWNAIHGSGKSPAETAEQRVIRKWLQGEEF